MQYSGYFSSHGILFPSETVTQQQYTSEDIMERAFGILESAGLVCADSGGKPDFSTSHAITLLLSRTGVSSDATG